MSGLADIAKNFVQDQWIRAAALSSVNGLADRVFVELLADRDFAASTSGGKLLQDLLRVVGYRRKPEEIKRVLSAMVNIEKSDGLPKFALFASLGEALRRPGKSSSEDLSHNSNSSAYLNRMIEVAKRLARDKNTATPTRVEAIRVLGLTKFSTSRETLATLLQVEQPADHPPAVGGSPTLKRYPNHSLYAGHRKRKNFCKRDRHGSPTALTKAQ